MKRIKPQQFLILLLVAALAAAPFLIRGLIDRSDTGKETTAAVTPTPETTAEPTPTPEPTPLQFTTVDASYFDDALFIGDSRTVGIAEYGNLKNATYFADVGLNVYVAQTKAVAVKNVGTVTLPQLLSQKTFGKVYIMLGINELGTGTPSSMSRRTCTSARRARARTRRSITPASTASMRSLPRWPTGRTSSTSTSTRCSTTKTATCAPMPAATAPMSTQSTIWTGATGCAQRRSSAENEKKPAGNRSGWLFCDRAVTVLSHGLSRRDVCQRLMMYHTNPAQARTIPPPTAAKIMCLPPFPRKLRPVSGRGNKVTYLEVTSL